METTEKVTEKRKEFLAVTCQKGPRAGNHRHRQQPLGTAAVPLF